MTSPLRITCALAMLALVAGVSPAEAKRYSADRFDSRIEVRRGGTLQVTETVVFRFEDGTFTEVFRDVSSRRTDGVEFVSAAIDGAPLPQGDGPGQVEVRTGSRMRVTWRFAPVERTTRTFELVYLVRGGVRQEANGELFAFQVLPEEHKYQIASSSAEIDLPVAPEQRPELKVRRVGHSSVSVEGTRIRVDADTIASNGRYEVLVPLRRGSVLEAPPDWQVRQHAQRERAPLWAGAAALTLALALIVMFGIHQGYDTPPSDSSSASSGPAFPDDLSPAQAGALLTNGSPRIEHAMATLFSLAERGEVTISEHPQGMLGQRRFILRRRPARRPVAPYEQAALDVIFTHRGRTEEEVTLDKARSRLTGHFRRFGRALRSDMDAHGLLDEGRKQVRRRFAVAGISLAAGAAVLVPALGIPGRHQFGLWPLFIPAALALAALIASICYSAHTPLSNEGVRRRRYWRGFADYLKHVSASEAAAPADPQRLLPFAVALGVADRWSKYLKDNRVTVPSWFQAATPADSHHAFVAFVAYGGATGSSGGAGGVSAGGGASGAR